MKRIGFLLIDGHAMLSMAAAVEPLRAANQFAAGPVYDICILSVTGDAAVSSVGSRFDAVPIRHAGTGFDMVFVVATGTPEEFADQAVFRWLRRLDRAGVALGAISGGAALLASAGLLTNRRFTAHWHHYDAIKLRFPDLLIERRLFVIDRDRYTCAGGTAPLDMMHAVIARDHGSRFAQRISDWFIQTEIRMADAPQHSGVTARFGLVPRAVQAALELMESHIADPLGLSQIAGLTGVSSRQLQRKFHESVGTSVMDCYRQLRLETARDLLQKSRLRIDEIAFMTGFSTQAHFADCCRRQFGRMPTELRKDGVRSGPCDMSP